MQSYKNALLLLIFSGLIATAGAFLKIMHWSSVSSYLMIAGMVGHFASIGIGLFVFFRNRNSSKT
jgi:divalent metal cation (Fe/Co/Zn/Cd) transporter